MRAWFTNYLGAQPPMPPPSRRCVVEGCPRPKDAKGYCASHYSRWRRYGDPLAGGTPRGVLEAALREVLMLHRLGYLGDTCIIWPFNCDPYPEVGMNGRRQRAHRWLCEQVN